MPFPLTTQSVCIGSVVCSERSHLLKLSLLCYGVGDGQKLQGPDPRPGQSQGGTTGTAGSAALPLHTRWRGDFTLAFALKVQDPGTLPLKKLCRILVPVHRVWIWAAEGKNGLGVAVDGSGCVFSLAVQPGASRSY